MTKQFTTPCHVKVTDARERKELCDWLSKIGYAVYISATMTSFYWICTYLPNEEDLDPYVLGEDLEDAPTNSVNCGINIPMFLALAAMNNCDDKYQWFIRIDTKELYLCKVKKFKCAKNIPGGFYRKATVPEIIEHFKTKEK